MLNSTATAWRESGLLEKLSDEQSNELSNHLDEIALYLIALEKNIVRV